MKIDTKFNRKDVVVTSLGKEGKIVKLEVGDRGLRYVVDCGKVKYVEKEENLKIVE